MSIKRNILWRVGIVYFSFLLFGLLIIGRTLYIQIFEKNKWEAEASAYILKNMIIPADRGSIYAADGRLLASSVPYYEIRFDTRCNALTDKVFNAGVDSLAYCLSGLFKDKPGWQYRQELIAAREQGKRYHLIKSGVNYIQLKQLKTFPIFRRGKYKGGFIYLQESKRIRPHQNLAARLIGYTTKDENGNVVGIEGAYEDQLNGVEGVRLMQRLSGDIWMPVNDRNEIEPRDGADVITTIDVDIQDVAEKALIEQLWAQDARHGTAILMEVQTGEVKAMVNLSKDSQGRYRELQNFAIGESTEPGSTFKLPALIAALEDGYVDLNDTIDTGDGTFKYYDKVIRDEQSKHGGYGELTVKQVFEYSSNVGMAKIITGAYKNQPQHFVDRLYRMRLNESLGIEIKGEGKPIIRYPDEKMWSGISLAQMSYGYEVRLTPLQILAFYNAIANNGKMVKPLFVKELQYHGKTVKSFGTEVLQSSVCSKATLKKVRLLLEGVVENGTAKNLRNDQIKIAGKTGTNQIYDKKYGYKTGNEVSYQASFVGYFPADDPRYSCIVVVNSPSKQVYYGNQVAGPVFLEIARKVYATAVDMHHPVEKIEDVMVDLPYSKNGNRDESRTALSELRIPVENKRIQSTWVNTTKNEQAVQFSERTINENLVPDVVSLGAKDAVFLLENAGLRVIIVGKGSVRSQSILPGTRVRKGERILLEMTYTD
jgi:cell division protein FtsI (penicillin-binding protein 3)